MKERIIAISLLIAMLVALTSCKKEKNNNNQGGGGLNIEVEELEYTEDDVSAAADEVKDIAKELVSTLGYENQVNDDDIEEIGNIFKEDILPILIDVKIYPSELTSLLDCTRECIVLADEKTAENTTPKIISDMYTKCVSILDADRFGALVYELQIFAINRKAMSVKEKYDKYGYAFYLEETEYYESVIEKANELGRTDFASALSALIFTASMFNGSANFEGDGVSISVSDSVAIMEKQAKKFAELELDSKDWQIVAEMCEVFISKEVSDDLKGRILLALDDSDFFIESMALMPELIEFYAKIMNGVSKENIALIESGAEYAYVRAVCYEILKNENAFRALMSALEEKIPAPSDKCLELINIYDKSRYNTFVNSYNSNASELIASIKTFSSNPTSVNYDTLIRNCIGYAAGINSVVTYVYLYK